MTAEWRVACGVYHGTVGTSFSLRLPWFTRAATLRSPPPSGELSLVARLANEDPRALAEAYDAHHERVRVLARRIVGDDAIAEDLVHDTFLALPRAASGFRGDASLATFVTSIALRKAARHVRSAARRRRALDKMSFEPTPSEPSPEECSVLGERKRVLLRALDALSMDHRVVLVLCDLEERTSEEAASVLGIPSATVRTRLFVARKKLRERLTKEGL